MWRRNEDVRHQQPAPTGHPFICLPAVRYLRFHPSMHPLPIHYPSILPHYCRVIQLVILMYACAINMHLLHPRPACISVAPGLRIERYCPTSKSVPFSLQQLSDMTSQLIGCVACLLRCIQSSKQPRIAITILQDQQFTLRTYKRIMFCDSIQLVLTRWPADPPCRWIPTTDAGSSASIEILFYSP
jgi:hypothetical protein